MITTITPVTPSFLQQLYGWNYQKARRELSLILASVGDIPVFLVYHLAQYMRVPPAEIINNYSTKK